VENNNENIEDNAQIKFGKNQLYRQDGALSRKVAAICIVSTLIVILPIFFISPPDTRKSGVEAPGALEISNPPSLLISFFEINQPVTRNSGRMPRAEKLRGLQSFNRPRAGRVPPGSITRAVLLTGASNGSAKAEVKEAVRIRGETLLPSGTILIGSGQSTEDRLYLRFSQAVFPDGSFEPIQAEAADAEDRIVGLKGSKVGYYATKLAAAVGLNFVGGMTEGLQEKIAVGQEAVIRTSPKNALLNGASRASLELANETMSGLKGQQAVIEVDAGKEILVIFQTHN